MTFQERLIRAYGKSIKGNNKLIGDTMAAVADACRKMGYEVIYRNVGGMMMLVIRKGFFEQPLLCWKFTHGGKVRLAPASGWLTGEFVETDNSEELRKAVLDWMGRRLISI